MKDHELIHQPGMNILMSGGKPVGQAFLNMKFSQGRRYTRLKMKIGRRYYIINLPITLLKQYLNYFEKFGPVQYKTNKYEWSQRTK